MDDEKIAEEIARANRRFYFSLYTVLIFSLGSLFGRLMHGC